MTKDTKRWSVVRIGSSWYLYDAETKNYPICYKSPKAEKSAREFCEKLNSQNQA